MKNNNIHSLLGVFLSLLLIMSCQNESSKNNVSSPDNNIKTEFAVNDQGEPFYTVKYKGNVVIDASFMSFDFKDLPPLKDNFKIVSVSKTGFDETWEMPWGEQLEVRNNYNELFVILEEQSDLKRKLNIRFRTFNDGVGFRYEFPEQENLKEVLITDENTQFNLTGDHDTWWIPGDWDIYEHLYNESKVSEIDAISKQNHPNLASTYIPENAVNTPVTMRTRGWSSP